MKHLLTKSGPPEFGTFSERKTFSNESGYEIGQIRIVSEVPYVVTAVTYENKKFTIYGLPANTPMKLIEFKNFQMKREAGQIAYLPGKKLFTV